MLAVITTAAVINVPVGLRGDHSLGCGRRAGRRPGPELRHSVAVAAPDSRGDRRTVDPGDRRGRGVGSALLELAQLEGITVHGTSSPGRRAIVEAAGGRWVADAASVPGKVDAVFDPVGGPSLAHSRRATRSGGVVVSFGFSSTVAAAHSKYVGLARTVWALLRARLTKRPHRAAVPDRGRPPQISGALPRRPEPIGGAAR